jgi:hypothetical protein
LFSRSLSKNLAQLIENTEGRGEDLHLDAGDRPLLELEEIESLLKEVILANSE